MPSFNPRELVITLRNSKKKNIAQLPKTNSCSSCITVAYSSALVYNCMVIFFIYIGKVTYYNKKQSHTQRIVV